MTVSFVCYLVALILFAIAAFGISPGKINLMCIGLAFLTAGHMF